MLLVGPWQGIFIQSIHITLVSRDTKGMGGDIDGRGGEWSWHAQLHDTLHWRDTPLSTLQSPVTPMVGDAHNDAAVPTLNQYLLVGIDYNNVSLSGQLSSLNLNFIPDPSASEWARGVFSLWIWTKSSVHLSFSTRYHLEARLDSELKWLASLHDSTRGINGENFQHLNFYFQLLSNMLRGQMRAERGIDQRKNSTEIFCGWEQIFLDSKLTHLCPMPFHKST